MEIDVAGTDIDSIEVVTPGGAGSFDLEEDSEDPGIWEIPLSVTQDFGSQAALFAAFPSGTYTFNIEGDGGASSDTISRSFSPTSVNDFLSVSQPTSSGAWPVSVSVTWGDCSSCDGNRLVGFAEDASGTEVHTFDDTDLTRMTWSPPALSPGRAYDLEMILGQERITDRPASPSRRACAFYQ